MIYTAFMAGFFFNSGLKCLFMGQYGFAILSFLLVVMMLCEAHHDKKIFSIKEQIKIVQECLEKDAENKSKNKQQP